MLKNNKQLKNLKYEVSLANAIDGRILTTEGWKTMDEDLKWRLLDRFKQFMLEETCHYNSNPYKTLQHTNFNNLQNIGLYDRLVYNVNRDMVQYVAGQDYPTEIKNMKRFMMRKNQNF